MPMPRAAQGGTEQGGGGGGGGIHIQAGELTTMEPTHLNFFGFSVTLGGSNRLKNPIDKEHRMCIRAEEEMKRSLSEIEARIVARLEKAKNKGKPKPGVLGASPKTSSVRKLQEKLTAIFRRVFG